MIIVTAQVEWFEDKARETEMVCTCAVDGQWIYWTKDAEDEAGRQQEKRKTTDKIHGCSEGKACREMVVIEEDNRDRVIL